MSDAMRSQVLDAILALFPQKGTPAAEQFLTDYGLEWSVTSRDALDQLPKGKKTALGVYGGTAARAATTSFQRVLLPCTLEVYFYSTDSGGKTKALERMLAVAETVLKANSTLGGLVVNIEVTGEQTNIDGPYDNQVDAALYFDVLYFHREDDPTIGRS